MLPPDVTGPASRYGDSWSYGVSGVQVGGIVDLDGDGVEEVVWVSQPTTPGPETKVQVSYVTDGAHKIHDVVSCSYSGYDRFLPSAQCRGVVKYKDKP